MKNKTLQDIIKEAALGERGITFINGRDEDSSLSYKELYGRALALLNRLRRFSVEEGDEVIFQLQDSEHFVTLFWACLLGGMIPVPLTTGDSDENRLKLFKVWETLQSPFLVIEERHYKRDESFCKEQLQGSAGRVLLVEDVMGESEVAEPDGLEIPVKKVSPDDIAFIQFSSGSTGSPKGVTLTHKNLLTNLEGIVSSAGMDENDIFLSWMPLTHDMGMIGFHLVPLFLGINQYIIPSTLFIRRPFIWIDRVNRYRATILSSPNFGYKYFLKHFDKMDSSNWDLSCIRLIFNGAEPISSALCKSFLERLEPFGLKRETMFTVYGLAEASLAVAFPPPGQSYKTTVINRRKTVSGEPVTYCEKSDKEAMEFVIEGTAVKGCLLRIVDENGELLPDDTIGSIEISGDNVTSGYYNNAEATKSCISPEGWLNTGDLGFMKEGRLVVTGRAKDIIFMNGTNYYSHDLERSIEEELPELSGSVALFARFDSEIGEDSIMAALIYRKSDMTEFAALASRVRCYIYEQLGLPVAEIIPIRSIPKTTSGKMQRYKIKESFEAGEYDDKLAALRECSVPEIGVESECGQNAGGLEESVISIVASIVECQTISAETPFFELGLDSLGAMKLAAELPIEGEKPSLEEIYRHPSARSLASYLMGRPVKGQGKAAATKETKREFTFNRLNPEQGDDVLKVLAKL